MRKRPIPKFPERDKKWPGKKNTRLWCKGVVGREHKIKTVRWPIGSNWIGKYRYLIDICEVCQKQMNLRRDNANAK